MVIKKRNGEVEQFSSEKLLKVLEWACSGLSNVEPLEILMQTKMKIRDGIKSSKVQEALIRSASDLISIKTLDYQFVASRLLSMHTRKQIFGRFLDDQMPTIKEVIELNIEKGYYDPQLLTKFTEADMEILERTINHSNDNDLTYASYRKIIDSYVMKDRDTKYVYETPQYMFMVMSMAFSDTIEEVVENYNALVQKSTSYATPILAGVRTTTKQFASCVLIDIDDSVDSMGASNHGIMRFIAKKAGLGINFGRWRGAGSKIRNGEVIHTGKIPLLRISQNSVKGFSQGGIRGGSATAFYPCWDSEFEQLIVLKNDKGTEDNRLKGLDYCVQLTGYFVKKMINNETISLFSTSNVPDLYEAWGQPHFDELYEKYVADKSIPRKEVKGIQMLESIAEERQGTGRYYIMFMDNVNKHSRFDDPIYQSNLCMEVVEPTKPIKHVDDEDGEIALCNLGAINLGIVHGRETFEQMRKPLHLLVKNVDKIISIQEYPVAGAKHQEKRRSLGIGVTNFAYWMAKNHLNYNDPKALPLIDELFEHFQYYLIEGSMLLAKEIGACEYFNRTKWSRGYMPIDDQNKNARDLVGNRAFTLDWEWLRSEVAKYGLRNSVLSALMPVESSSLVTNSTNGIEPPRDLLTTKGNETSGFIKMAVPEALELAEHYTSCWDVSNSSINKIVGVMQMWVDQAISVNHYYNLSLYPNSMVSKKEIIKDIIEFYKYGGKNLYYSNTLDAGIHNEEEDDCTSCKV